MNILITAGGTTEKIDQVRSITNTSTGQTAHSIAKALFENGFKNIYYVHAKKSQSFESAKENTSFLTSDDLEKSLKNILKEKPIDIIIHAAAVSDFVVDKYVINGELFESGSVNKISSQDDVELILKKRSKIIDQLKSFAYNHIPIVIGFKLTNTKEPEDQMDQVLKLSMSENVDFVVHNDLNDIDLKIHKTKIYFKDQLLYSGETKENLNKNILELINHIKQNSEAHDFNQEHTH